MAEGDDTGRKRRRMVKTVCLVSAWLSAGMYMSMVGPALIDLTEIVGCNYEQLAYALTAKNVGLTAAALVSGYYCSRYQRHLEAILSVNLVLLGLGTAAVPWCPVLPAMAAAMMVQGLTHGVLGVAGNSWIAVMWEGSSAGPLHALHFGNSIGSVVAPLLVRPFLSPDVNATGQSHGNHSGNSTLPVSSTRIQIPFGIYGAYTVLWGAVFIWFYISDRRSPQKQGLFYLQREDSVDVLKESDAFAGVKKSFGVFMAVVFFLLYLSLSGVYQAIPTYLMPVSVDGPLHITKQAGNLLIFGFTLSLVVGRLLATVLSRCVATSWLLYAEVALTFALAIVLYFYGLSSVIFLWVLSCAFSFTSAPIFPAIIAWAEDYLEIAGPLMAVFFVGSGSGALVFQWLCGFGIQNFGPYFPLYANLGAASATTLLFLVAVIRCRMHGPREKSDSFEEKKPSDNFNVNKATERDPLIN